MPRKTAVKTLSDLVDFCRVRRKKRRGAIERALKSPDAVRKATEQFARSLCADANSQYLASLKQSKCLYDLLLDEYKLDKPSRREAAQHRNGKGTSKRTFPIGPAVNFGSGACAISYRLPRTLARFVEEWVRETTSGRKIASKKLWNDLPLCLSEIGTDVKILTRGAAPNDSVRNQSVTITIAGQAERISWYAFERIVRQAKHPIATIGDLSFRC
jgi:hypothetical protein